jgi:FkbM family methyltransferase
MSIKGIVRQSFRTLGLDIRRYVPPTPSPLSPLISSLKKFEIDLVVDVGANRGQFATELRQSGYEGKLISYEPLSDAYRDLQNFSKGDEAWQVPPRCAIGDRNGEVEINISRNSESSSILHMMESHRSAAPESAYLGKEVVPIKMLDTLAIDNIKGARSPFLKIDTQGFEWHVLDGARATLPYVKGILVELSLVPLYEGQHLWNDVMDRLESEGFTLWAIQPVFSDPVSGRTLQVDGIFFRLN